MDTTLEQTIRQRIEIEKARTGQPADAVPVPLIPTGRYTDPAFYDLERERVFGRCWLFVGHESEWPDPGCYRVTARSGSPIVVVRGDDGVLRAFYNSCRHRGAPVTRDECGTARRLTCQYHSWSYGVDGSLKAVPDARSFVDLDTATLGLVPVRCETWDGWVFVSEDPDAPSLVEFLGPIADQMAEIDGPSMRAVGTQVHVLDCNWKLMVACVPRGVPRAHGAPRQRRTSLQRPVRHGHDAAQRPQPPDRREARRLSRFSRWSRTSTTTRRCRCSGVRHRPRSGSSPTW